MSFVTQYSLGNMGGSESLCKFSPMDSKKLILKCTMGYLDSKNAIFGIVPHDSKVKNYCVNNNVTQRCTQYMDMDKVQQILLSSCSDIHRCELNVAQMAQEVILANTTDDYVQKCMDSEANFFVQVPCVVHDDAKIERQVEGLFIGCMGVFMALFFVVFIDYLRSIFKNQYVEWDVKTITAGDYSVELKVTEKMWKNFLRTQYKREVGKTKLHQFRNYLQRELEDRLTEMPDLGYEEETPEKINICLITFAFDNSELINLLKERGNAIKFEKWDKMRVINKKINELKTKNADKYNRPVTAFITFENEEGINRCRAYNDVVQTDSQYSHYQTFLGEELNIEDASEPTDIIWENRHYTGWDRFKRTLIVCGYVSLVLSVSFVVIFLCSQEANKPLLKYPPQNCTEMAESQGQSFKINAFAEWDRNFDENGDEIDDPVYMGILKCYCDNNIKNTQGFTKNSLVDGVREDTEQQAMEPICAKYARDTFNAKIIGYSMSFIIVSINYCLRLIVIKWVKWIGHDTHSSQIKAITNGVFIAQFLNTGILLLLVQANFGEVMQDLSMEIEGIVDPTSIINQIFNGPFYDYVPLWYTAVGYKVI